MQHWINNHKKRHVGADTNTADTSDHSLRKRRKVRKPSSYNAFSKEFHRQDTLRGKSLAEKSILMAQAWRELDRTEREKYTHGDEESTDCTVEQLSSVERKKLIMRVAKCHQGDANLLQSLGCNVATMMHVDGQTITVGTVNGKGFLHSHPAILSSFNSYFLYENFSRQYTSTATITTSTSSVATSSTSTSPATTTTSSATTSSTSTSSASTSSTSTSSATTTTSSATTTTTSSASTRNI